MLFGIVYTFSLLSSHSPSVTKTLPRFGFLSLDLKKSSHLAASLGAKGYRDSATLSCQYTGVLWRVQVAMHAA